MAGWVNAEELEILRWYFAGFAKTPSAQIWVGLLIGAGNDDGSFTEPSYTAYTRMQVDQAWTPGAATNPSEIYNTNEIQFPQVNDNPGQIASHFGIFSANVGSTMLFHGEVVVPPGGLTLSLGIDPTFDPGSLFLRLGG